VRSVLLLISVPPRILSSRFLHNLLLFTSANTAAPKTQASKPTTASSTDFDEKIAAEEANKKKEEAEQNGDPQKGQVRSILALNQNVSWNLPLCLGRFFSQAMYTCESLCTPSHLILLLYDDLIFLIIPQQHVPTCFSRGPQFYKSMWNPPARKRAAHDGLRRVHPNDD